MILIRSKRLCSLKKFQTTVVWKYFVVKKFSWVMEPTKIYYTNNKQGSYAMKFHLYMHMQH